MWTVAATALAVLLLVPVVQTLRGKVEDRLVALQAANVLTPLALIAVAVAASRSVYVDVALLMALLSLVGGLAYARFTERWL